MQGFSTKNEPVLKKQSHFDIITLHKLMTSYKVSRHVENIPEFTRKLQILDEIVQLMSAPWITLPNFSSILQGCDYEWSVCRSSYNYQMIKRLTNKLRQYYIL